MKKWLLAALFGCSVAQADMLDALQAHENKNYSDAQQQFAELLPLGNELAAFNLGVMALQGEGQEQDISEALGYFMLAAELEHPQAKDVLQTVVKQATEQQLDQANQRYEKLKSGVVIIATDLDKPRDASLPQPVKRVHPKYPVNAARTGQFGFVNLRFLVDEQGQVTAVDTLDAYPETVFEKASIRAVKRWRYQPSGQKHLMSVRLSYSLSGGVKVSAVEKTVAEHNLWNFAVAGSSQHQLVLGMLLSLIEIQSGNGFWYNPELPLATEADFSIYEKRAELKPDFDGFWGYAVVRVAKDGTITEQIKTKFEPRSEITNLVGLKLKGNVESEVYRLNRRSDISSKSVSAQASVEVSRAMSGMFWWEQAAKNGNKDAQRIMAASDQQWEAYLLSQNDAEVMAWTGTRLILEGQREQGLALLDQAIAKNYKPATEMKKQFM
ncbi:TonB family protein [Arsukibacterium sp.]|uniref:TonB family protein n=1 Tax=Arsukibacterium sp. TaxID=1977258 RepID=UPI00356977E8